MARGVFVKIGRYWHPLRFPYVNDSTGKPVKIKAGWSNVSGQWRQFWPPGLPATVVVIGAGGGKGGDDVTAGYIGNPGHRVVGTVGLNSGQDIIIGIGGRGDDGWTGTGNPGGAGGFGGSNFGGGPGGASGGLHGWSGSGGGGGGASYLQVDGQNIIIAAGGGGGGGGGWGYIPPPPAPPVEPVIPQPPELSPSIPPPPPAVTPPPVPQSPVPVPPVYPIYISDGEGGAQTLWINTDPTSDTGDRGGG